ncbi:hypothetical protein ABW20_dc0102261 [Dactylellina cionopaga]|nr:hypothetical protein ABW20_dc0102261 [Dactylellina cionopaga]
MLPLNDNTRQLLPELSILWMYHPWAVDNYETSIYQDIRNGNIEVIRDTITSMEGSTIALSSGESLTADAMVFATGWKTNLPLFSEEMQTQLGLPSTLHDGNDLGKWEALEAEAERSIYSTNPFLKDAPKPPKIQIPPQHASAFRLYHHIIPTDFADRTIAFPGSVIVGGTMQYAIIMSVWTAAYMLGKLELPNKEEMERVAAYELRYTQLRHPAISNDHPMISYDYQSINSMLMKELGLNPLLKKGWISELFGAYTCHDYKDLSRKWMAKHGIVA